MIVLPTNAKGDETAVSNPEVPGAVERALVGGAEHELAVAGNGEYVIEPSLGAPLRTHGPDKAALLAAGSRRSFRVGDPERQPVCAEDYYQEIVYAVPASRPDRYAQSVNKIRGIVRRMNSLLNRSSRASGGGSADYKVLCDVAGQIQVSRVIVHGGSSFSDIVGSARAAGFDRANVDYTIFSDDVPTRRSCGVGSYSDDQSLSPDNANNSGGDYAVTYRDCWYSETPMHENGHNQGAVQYGAPHSTGKAHCWDAQDVMCYSPDGGDKHQRGVATKCQTVRFDCDHDDYFDTAPRPGEYLSRHWNIGSRLNRFVSFGAGE